LPSEIATYSGEGLPDQPARVNVLVINTARDQMEALASSGPWCLIVDECHRAGSPENSRALEGVFAATLGLSATPEREYDAGLDDLVVPVLGDVIYRYGYQEARRDGVITPFDLVHVRISLTASEQAAYDRMTRRIAVAIRQIGGEPPTESVKRLFQRRAAIAATAQMRIPAALRLVENTHGGRTLVFHERVRAANQLLHLMQSRRLSATIYHTGVNPVLRRSNLSLYRRGVFDVLVCCRALDEGINVPETAYAVVASSTASTRQRIQRLGRVLRPAPGKERAVIYTVYATDAEERRLRDEAVTLGDAATSTWMQAHLNA
jgi:superfamily II DNA or RNA helicase